MERRDSTPASSPPRDDYPWWHSIELPSGTTEGFKSPEHLARELASLDLPDLAGKTVLDIGAWDGFYSFSAERLGAKRVVSLDYHVWGLPPEFWDRWRAGEATTDSDYQDYWDSPGLLDLVNLPGRRNYERAHRELQSRVEAVVGDFMTMDLAALGTFDVVLFLGVLYHLKHPLLGLERLRSVTRECAVIETEAVRGPGSYLEFYGGRELSDDPTNWWAPTEDALLALCRTAGFSRVDTKVGSAWRGPSFRDRLRYLVTARQELPPHYRAVVHAIP